MSIEQAERLKREWTDKYVVVREGVPELRRFAGLTGRVKTVNMNCRALVEFDGPADIGWYDIDPFYLSPVEAPLKRTKAEAAEPPKAAPAAKKPAGKSPLELAREQAAAGAAAKPAAKPKSGLSPLELARQQAAAKQTTAEPSAAKQPAEKKAAAPGKKLSPLELARQQGAAKREGTASAAAAEQTEEAPAAEAQAPAENEQQPLAEKPQGKTLPAGEEGKKLSPLELARRQGPAKR